MHNLFIEQSWSKLFKLLTKESKMKALLPILTFLWPVLTYAQFSVGERTITFNDPSRNNRAIECEIYYPAASAGTNVPLASGSFPVIVFGHGFTMQPTAYPNWKDEFVPEGYIMVFPSTETGFSPSHEAFGLDLKFMAIEMQNAGSDNSSPFYQHVFNRTAIMGHSMGGGASLLAASNFSGVDCIVGLAPAETNPSAVSAAANALAPTLILSGESDGVTPPAEHHIPIYDGAGSGCKYFVSITDGSHCRFASNPGLCTFGEIIPGTLSAGDQQAVSYAVCRPWFEYFLKEDCSAWDDFQTALNTESNLGTINSICLNDAPVITDNGSSLESNQQSNYQWYLNGTEIPNATQQTFNYTQSGIYQVGTVVLGNCPTLSNEINVQITGIEEYEIEVKSDNAFVTLTPNLILRNSSITWLDVSGRILEVIEIGRIRANQPITINRPSKNGVHLLRLTSENYQQTWQFVTVSGN